MITNYFLDNTFNWLIINQLTHFDFLYFLGSKLDFPLLEDNSPFRLVFAPPSLILQPDLGLQEVNVVPEKVSRETKNNKGSLFRKLFFSCIACVLVYLHCLMNTQ